MKKSNKDYMVVIFPKGNSMEAGGRHTSIEVSYPITLMDRLLYYTGIVD